MIRIINCGLKSLLIVMSVTLLTSTIVHAETTRGEFSALSKVLALSKNIVSGPMTLGVIHNPNDPTSVNDLKAIQKIVASGFKGPKNYITIEPIASSQIDNIKGLKALFVTSGVDERTLNIIQNISKRGDAITITTDKNLVKSNKVILGIDDSFDTIKIFMNRDLYQESGLLFDAAFKFMVKEI